MNQGGAKIVPKYHFEGKKQDGAASESSSSRERIVRKFSCQDIGHWTFEFRLWTLNTRVETLDI